MLIAGVDMLAPLGVQLPDAAQKLASRYWPGPLTLVLPVEDGKRPRRLRGYSGGAAVRWTSHLALSKLIRGHGGPITSTSANRPGAPPAVSGEDIAVEWAAEVGDGRLLVLDGAELAPSPPSTVVDCTGAEPVILRAGAIQERDLLAAVASSGSPETPA
jgi:L-threonylcarbamoyladenylate synthase